MRGSESHAGRNLCCDAGRKASGQENARVQPLHRDRLLRRRDRHFEPEGPQGVHGGPGVASRRGRAAAEYRKYWTRRGIAEWLAESLSQGAPTLVGIDHAFSFPIRTMRIRQRPGCAWRISRHASGVPRAPVDRRCAGPGPGRGLDPGREMKALSGFIFTLPAKGPSLPPLPGARPRLVRGPWSRRTSTEGSSPR